MKFRNPFKNLTKGEWILYLTSMSVVLISYIICGTSGILSMISSIVGLTSLIFLAKGDVFAQVVMIIFAVLYCIVSYSFEYYGEMITYMGMTMPMSVVSLVSWIKNPYDKENSQVKVAHLSIKSIVAVSMLTVVVTVIFYFILDYFNTANMFFSTISIATSFFAASFTALRSPYYALAYGANDIVLIILWTLATAENLAYAPMIVCFIMFLINDIYGFICWKKMMIEQSKG